MLERSKTFDSCFLVDICFATKTCLRDGDSIQKHIKDMTEIFNELAAIDDPITEEDRVVHLLASLPESYDILGTALEASVEVPKMEIVTERLLHEERKIKEKHGSETSDDTMKAMFVNRQSKGKGPKCYHCGKFGHIKRNCRELNSPKLDDDKNEAYDNKHKANNAAESRQAENSSDSDEVGLMINHAFSSLTNSITGKSLKRSLLVTGMLSKQMDRGVVKIEIECQRNQKVKNCVLQYVLYVPSLSYNLVSVSKATKSGKTVTFDEDGCHILDESQKLIANAKRMGNLYYLSYVDSGHHANPTVESSSVASKEVTWRKRYGHLGVQNLQKLAKEKLVDGYDYDKTKDIDFCESCTEGKHHRSTFPVKESERGKKPLDLVHSDVCGKMSAKSLGGAEYFLTFIDDNTHYVWVYVLNFWSGKPWSKNHLAENLKYFVQTMEGSSHQQNLKIISRKKE